MAKQAKVQVNSQVKATAQFLFGAMFPIVVGFIAELKKRKITLDQFLLLAELHKLDGQGNSALADALDIDRPSTSALLTRLEKAGLIRRERPARGEDLRGIKVYLEPSAKQLMERVPEPVMQAISQMFTGLSDGEVDNIQSWLRRATIHRVPDKSEVAAPKGRSSKGADSRTA